MNGAAGEIRTPEVRHHRISNPAQWPGYATAARKWATCEPHMNMTVEKTSVKPDLAVHQSGPRKPNHFDGRKVMMTNERNIQPR